jgi:hypothetical protein
MEHKCSICGTMDDPEQYVWGEIRSNMEEHHTCFNCGFWQAKLEQDRTSRDLIPLIIDGSHYYARKTPKIIGYDGAVFVLKLNKDGSGQLIIDSRLTHQGKIPLRWRPKFRNNAFFITYEDFIQIEHLSENTSKAKVDITCPPLLMKEFIEKYNFTK